MAAVPQKTNRPDNLPKVAIICNTFSASFIFRKTLISRLHEVEKLATVVSSYDDSDKIQSWAADVSRLVLPLNISGLRNAARALRQAGTELCHGFTHVGNMAALALGLMLQVPVVMNVTGMGRAFSTQSVRNLILKTVILGFYFIAQFRIQALIVQNRDDAELFRGIFIGSKKHLVRQTNGSGIDPEFFAGIQPAEIGQGTTRIRVGFFSRALPQKGVVEYYDLAAAHRDNPDIEFYHIGHSGEGVFSRDEIGKYAVEHNVSYLDFKPDPRPFLLAMDIVVLPSHYREGLSRLSIEAMLAGKIVVAQDTTGIREHLTSGENGFLYMKVDDLPQTFDQALAHDRASVGDAAHAYARKHFDVANVDQVYLDAYDMKMPGNK